MEKFLEWTKWTIYFLDQGEIPNFWIFDYYYDLFYDTFRRQIFSAQVRRKNLLVLYGEDSEVLEKIV